MCHIELHYKVQFSLKSYPTLPIRQIELCETEILYCPYQLGTKGPLQSASAILQLQQVRIIAMQHCPSEQWERASSSKYSYPAESGPRPMNNSELEASRSSEFQRISTGSASRPVRTGQPTKKAVELRQQDRLGPLETVDDFITNESGNTLLLCVFSILLVFPGSACLLVIGGAFTLDLRLQQRHQWVRPCAIAMLVLGAVLLVTASVIFASIVRSYRRARMRRLCTAVATATGSPYTCIVQL